MFMKHLLNELQISNQIKNYSDFIKPQVKFHYDIVGLLL